MKRFVLVRAVDGIAVPDPRDPLFGPGHFGGERRYIGREPLGRDALMALAKAEGVLPRQLDVCERFPASDPVVMELDRTMRKLIERGEVEQVGKVVEARTAAKAAEQLVRSAPASGGTDSNGGKGTGPRRNGKGDS